MNRIGDDRQRGVVASALRGIASIALLYLAFGAVAQAGALLPQPKGPVVLVITGDITRANGPNRASFDLEMLKQVGLTSLVTSTPWTEGTSRFEGVLARDLLAYVGARGDHITAISMNDYLVEIPVKDFTDHDVIFALKRDGKYLGVRDMGPVLIVYPFDRDASLWTESVFTRCVLQLGAVYVGTPGSVPLASLLPGEESPGRQPWSDTAGNGGGAGPGGGSNQAGGPGTGIGGNGNSGMGAGQQGTGTGAGAGPSSSGGQSAVHGS
jgi:hypothetical protein